jgi:hypothetical protein
MPWTKQRRADHRPGYEEWVTPDELAHAGFTSVPREGMLLKDGDGDSTAKDRIVEAALLFMDRRITQLKKLLTKEADAEAMVVKHLVIFPDDFPSGERNTYIHPEAVAMMAKEGFIAQPEQSREKGWAAETPKREDRARQAIDRKSEASRNRTGRVHE